MPIVIGSRLAWSLRPSIIALKNILKYLPPIIVQELIMVWYKAKTPAITPLP